MNQKVTSLEQAFFFSAEVQVTFHHLLNFIIVFHNKKQQLL